MAPAIKTGVTQTFFGRVRKSAAARGITFDLTLSELVALMDSQGGRCVYTGRTLLTEGRDKINFSLDRMDSSNGYTSENCQFVFKPVNQMKHTMSNERFLDNVSRIITARQAKNVIPSPQSRRPQYRGADYISGEVLGSYRSGANRRGIPFDLTADQVNELYLSQGGMCAYTLRPVNFAIGSAGNASIDRIDSGRGYRQDNVTVVHKEVNFMKGAMTEQAFFSLCEEIFIWSVILGMPNASHKNTKEKELV